MPEHSAIEFVHVSYRLESSRELLFDIDLAIAPGEVFMLLGRSGSGKTTSLKLINRVLTPTEGEVRVDGAPTTHWDPIALRRKIGYAIQEVGLFPHYTVEQNIALVPKPEHWPKEKMADRFGALARRSRTQSQKEFQQLQPRLKKPVASVTHDVGEALLLGDRIALL